MEKLQQILNCSLSMLLGTGKDTVVHVVMQLKLVLAAVLVLNHERCLALVGLQWYMWLRP